MRYNELKTSIDREHLELLEAMLIDEGFVSMQIDDPADELDILAHPDTYRYDYINEEIGKDPDRLPEITLYFTDDEEGAQEMDRAMKAIGEFTAELKTLTADVSGTDRQAPVLQAAPEMRVASAGDDSEWLYKWQEYFKPARVGERIVVRPSWEEYDAAPGELVIEMDPGMAFGSGLHETTSM